VPPFGFAYGLLFSLTACWPGVVLPWWLNHLGWVRGSGLSVSAPEGADGKGCARRAPFGLFGRWLPGWCRVWVVASRPGGGWVGGSAALPGWMLPS